MTPQQVAVFHTDDAPDGSGAQLQVYAGANHDWYVSIQEIREDELWYTTDGVRFSTSGSSHSNEVVLGVAMLGFLGNGEALRARECAASISHSLGVGGAVVVRREVADTLDSSGSGPPASGEPAGLDVVAFQRLNARRHAASLYHLDLMPPSHYAMALAGKVGELCNLIKIQSERGASIEALESGFGDVLPCLVLLAERCGVDLGVVTARRFDEVTDQSGDGDPHGGR